jgi:putative chitinase
MIPKQIGKIEMITTAVTEQALKRIAIDPKWVDPLNGAARKYNCNTYDRWCAIIPQLMHESAGFTKLRESLNYSPEGLVKTFKRRITPEQAAALGRINGRPADQVAIGNIVYGGREGNSPTEGFKYRGRGLPQLTFKNNYIKFERESRIAGIVEDPDIVFMNLDVAAEAGFWFFETNGLWKHATDFHAISSFVNTGRLNSSEKVINGYADRRGKFSTVRHAFLQP